MSAIIGGGGGGYDVTLGRFWLLGITEFDGTAVSVGMAEGKQLSYFRDVATTSAQRVQYDDGGASRSVWLRTCGIQGVASESIVYENGLKNGGGVSRMYSPMPVMCI